MSIYSHDDYRQVIKDHDAALAKLRTLVAACRRALASSDELSAIDERHMPLALAALQADLGEAIEDAVSVPVKL